MQNKKFSQLDVIKSLRNYDTHTTIVYTYGVWDLLHPGHVRLLEKAKDLGDILIVGVVSDSSVKELKGEGRPILNQQDRMEIIDAFWFTDYVIPQAKYDPSTELNRFIDNGIAIRILTKGDDWLYIPGVDVITRAGGKLVQLPYSKQWSSSRMIEKITGKPVKKFGEPISKKRNIL